MGKNCSVNPFQYIRLTALAWSCFVFTGWSAPITYPNQAYTFEDGVSSPVPGAFNVKAVAVEGERGLAVTRNGRVISWGFPEHWLTNGVLNQVTNAISVGVNYTGGAVLTADGRVIELGRLSHQQPEVTNAIAIDVSGQMGDDDLDYKLAVTSDGRVVVWGLYEFWFPPSADIPGVVAAAGGWNHIVALKGDGTVMEWDIDNAPAVVAGLSNVVAVAAGGEHSVALKADGTVVAWGQNHFGQLNVPAGLSNVVAITAAEDHTLALKGDGTLMAWGRSYDGGDVTPPANLSNVLAIASSGTRNVVIGALPGPPPIPYPNQAYTYNAGIFSPVPGAFNVKAVALEGERGLAVLRNGRVMAWGFPDFWLTNGILDGITNAVAVGLNYTGAAALTEDGRVFDFENFSSQRPIVTNAIALDVSGQFGDDDLDFKLAVTSDGRVVVWGRYEDWHPPSAEVPGVVTAAAGWSHIVALKSDGTVVEWGVDSSPAVVAGLSNVVAVAAGGEHSVALKADGTVVAWGQNFVGQTNVPAGLSDVIAISAAEYHTLALKKDGTLVAWGTYYLGEDVTPPQNLSNVVAIATSASRDAVISALSVPPPITYPNQAYIFSGESFSPVPGAFNVKALAIEGDTVLAVTRDGRVVASGFQDDMLEQIPNAVAVGLNYTMGAALTADGKVIEVGGGSLQPPGLTNVIAIDVSGQFNDDDLDYKLAVTADGRVVTWGRYEFWYPPSAEIPGVTTAAGGWSHIVALKGDGTVVEWDMDNAPAVVGGLSNVVAVAAGGTHSVALKADGTVVAWGQNYFGQTNVPAGLSAVVAIAASEYQTLALKRDGTLVAWGQDYFGGNATIPPNLANVVAIASGGSINLALVSFPPQRPTLGIAANAPTSGQLTISLSGEPNKVYALETSTDLLTWHFVRHVTSEMVSTTFQVGNTNASRQFFRAR